MQDDIVVPAVMSTAASVIVLIKHIVTMSLHPDRISDGSGDCEAAINALIEIEEVIHGYEASKPKTVQRAPRKDR